MPELAEVEIARRNLADWTVGSTVTAVRVPDPAVVRGKLSSRPSDALPDGAAWLGRLVGQRSVALHRRGKRLGWEFESVSLLVHLGMSGKWVRGPEPRFARLGLVFGDTVWFADMRRFGCVSPASLPAELAADLGPDALDDPLTGEALRDRVSGRRAIKVALMDQRVVAGLGNIHAVEALWRAGIHPEATVLEAAAWQRLAEAIPLQLSEAIDAQRRDEMVYIREPGATNPFTVYGREGEPCPRCGAPIANRRLGGRSTFFCPGCQPG